MNEWELTTEEIEQARDYGEYEYEDDTPEVGQFIEEEVLAGNRAVATAAQKKLVEWMAKQGIATCSRHAFPGTFELPIHVWQSLETALGVK